MQNENVSNDINNLNEHDNDNETHLETNNSENQPGEFPVNNKNLFIDNKVEEVIQPVNLSLQEKLEKSNSLKEKGNDFFKQKKFVEAIHSFKAGLELLYGEGLSEEARSLMLSLNLNMCNCFNNLEMYEQTIERTNFSLKLKTSNPKVYYYRALALIKLNKIDQAENDYIKLCELLPSSDAGLTMIKQIIEKHQKPKENTKIFRSMLKSGVYQDREKDIIKRKRSDDSEDE